MSLRQAFIRLLFALSFPAWGENVRAEGATTSEARGRRGLFSLYILYVLYFLYL